MNQIRLKNISDNYFHQAWELYENAFPVEERRILDAQTHVMKKSNYHFDIVVDENKLIGFLLWWDFETLRYIDHFATSTEQRNKGFGKLILENFMNNNDKPILLEVELPNTTINQRRIKFYQRIGFKLNQHYYEVPPSTEGQKPLQLLLMSYPTLLTAKDVEQFTDICHPSIFKD
ncbi:GNAT family N-acetyltransferase [Aquimarina macrocephali]|uniref:GNAT family N-acetyltransferase n=1 Tax=Aquimarina macrocephali TaxID=666563 RepID=UPI000463B3E4|nr:GNAT family N-acetyltransferase [Aquimarina macrocephali]